MARWAAAAAFYRCCGRVGLGMMSARMKPNMGSVVKDARGVEQDGRGCAGCESSQ